jgi:hypothetical protein
LASSASVETLSDEAVQKQSKEFLEHMLDDENIKKKTAAAVWGVIGNMFLPAFLFKSSRNASEPPVQQPSPKTATSECDSTTKPTPWYHFSGVLGWVLPSSRKSNIDPVPAQHNNLNEAAVLEPSPSSSSSPPNVSATEDSFQTPSLPSSAAAAPVDSRFQQKNTSLPGNAVPDVSDGSSGTNAFREPKCVQSTHIPPVPHHVALLVPPSSANEGDNSFTDDDSRRPSDGDRRS